MVSGKFPLQLREADKMVSGTTIVTSLEAQTGRDKNRCWEKADLSGEVDRTRCDISLEKGIHGK